MYMCKPVFFIIFLVVGSQRTLVVRAIGHALCQVPQCACGDDLRFKSREMPPAKGAEAVIVAVGWRYSENGNDRS